MKPDGFGQPLAAIGQRVAERVERRRAERIAFDGGRQHRDRAVELVQLEVGVRQEREEQRRIALVALALRLGILRRTA